jgi:Fur family iron response transcriptional regulator
MGGSDMQNDKDSISSRLVTAGVRPTRQRLALAELLFNGADRHVTAEHLYSEAIDKGIRVSLATVYNTLHHFTDNGLLREVVVEAGRSYFDTNTSNHHHFFFVDSGGLQDIDSQEVEIVGLPQIPKGSTIEGVDVVVRLRTPGKN